MASSRIKGITVEIGGDTTRLSSALKGLDADLSKTQSQLRDVDKLLKLDPGNTELLAQKHKLLSQAVGDTSERLKKLKEARKSAEENLGNYDKWKEKYEPVRSEIEKTSKKLNELKVKREEMEKAGDIDTDEYKALSAQIDDAAKHLDELKKKQKEINDEFGNPISPEQYDSLKREIIDTENKLKDLKTQAGESAVALQKIAQAGEGLKTVGDKITDVGKALAPISAIAAAGLGAAAKTFSDFDAQLSRVQGIAQATDKEMEKLKEQALDLGGSTQFSAKEVADAYEYMGMAGWTAQQMTEGMPGVLALAAASGEDLATVCDILTDALTAFGLGADDAGHFADVLAVAASSANTNVSMMGETFKYVAPLAATLKLTAEDVAEVVGLMANAGVKASQAGTALRGGLSRLVKPTDEMIAKMKELGLAVDTFSEAEAKAQSDALQKGYDARKKALEQEEKALKKSLDAQYSERKKAFDKQEDALKKSLDAQYDEQKKALDKNADALKKSLDDEYDEQKKAFDKKEDALKKSLDAQYGAAKDAAEKQLDELKAAQEAEVAAFEKATDEKIAQIDRQYNENLKLIDEAKYNQIKAVEDQIAALNAQTEAERAEIEKRKQEQKKADLQAKIDSAKSAEDRKKAEADLSEYLSELAQKELEAQRKAQIEELKARKDAIKEQADAEKAALKEQTDAEKQAAQEDRKNELAALKEAQAQKQADLKEANEHSLQMMKDAQESVMSATKESNSEYLAELKEAHQSQIDALKESNSESLSALKERNQSQIDALKESNSEQLADYKETLDEQKDALKAHNDEILTEYKANVDAQTKALKDAVSTQSLILTDENGEMRSLNESVNILRDAFSGLSEAEQAEAATILFGQEAMSGWLAVLNAAPSDIEKLHNAIADCDGAAKNMADTMQNNLNGDVTALTSSVESLAISFGELLNDGLRDIVKEVKKLIDWANSLDKETKERIVKIGLLVAALSPLLIGLGSLISTVGTILTLAPKLGAAITLLSGPFGIAVAAVGALGAIFIAAYKNSETFRNGVNKVVDWIKDKLNAVKTWGKDLIDNFVSGIDDVPVIGAVTKIAKTIFDFLHFSEPEKGPLANFHTFAPDMVKTFADGITDNSGLVDNAASLVAGLVKSGLDTVKDKIADVRSDWETKWGDIQNKAADAGKAVAEKCAGLGERVTAFRQDFSGDLSGAADAVNDFRDKASKAWDAVKDGADSLDKKLSGVFANVGKSVGEMKDKVVGAFGNIQSSISDKIDAAKDWGKDLVANLTGGISDNLDNLADAATEMAQTVADRVGFSKPKKGPLSDADTYAPDMVSLFADGIRKSLPDLAKIAAASTMPIQAALSAPLPSAYPNASATQNAQIPALNQAYANSALRPAPVKLSVNNIIGGAAVSRQNYQYDAAESARRGPSFVKR